MQETKCSSLATPVSGLQMNYLMFLFHLHAACRCFSIWRWENGHPRQQCLSLFGSAMTDGVLECEHKSNLFRKVTATVRPRLSSSVALCDVNGICHFTDEENKLKKNLPPTK